MQAAHTPLDPYECQARLIWANERTVEPEHLRPRTGHEPIQVAWFLVSGRLMLHDRKRKQAVAPGQWVFPSQQAETHEFAPESSLISIRYLLRHRLGGGLFSGRRAYVVAGAECPELETAARMLIRRLYPWRTTQSLLIGRERIPLAENFAIESAFYEWLSGAVGQLLRAGETLSGLREIDSRVARAALEILDHPIREPFSEAVLAEKCGLAPSHLNRLFKLARGRTPFQEYEARRLELARHALGETLMPIKEIAYELGFNSPAHFSNWVRHKTGQSPRNCRRSTQTTEPGPGT